MNRQYYTFASRLAPRYLFVLVIAVVFLVEVMIMFLLDFLFHTQNNSILENFLDSLLLTMVCGPVVWWLIIHPLKLSARTEQTKYVAIVEAMVDGIVSMDSSGTIESCNHAAETIFGYSENELLGKNLKSLFSPKNNPETPTQFFKLISDLKAASFHREFLGRRKNGTSFSMEITLNKLTHERKPLITVIIRDIEQRKRNEIKIRQLSRAVEQSPCSVVITNTIGNIEYVNPKFSRVTGYESQEVIGQNPRILKSGEKPPEEYRELWETISSGQEWHGEFHNKKKNGELYWEYASISSIFDENGNVGHYLAVKEDITSRKMQEEEIQRLNMDLKTHSDELELVNQELQTFSYTVSHDLRNPLTIISGLSDILISKYAEKLDPPVHDAIRRIKINSQRMVEMIQDILLLSQASRKEMCKESVDLSLLSKSILDELQKSNPQRSVEIVIQDQLSAYGDPGLIRILLENLLGNAWKYTGKKPDSRIEVGAFLPDETSENQSSVFFIKDNGAGFDMTDVDRLFKPFQRFHDSSEFEGTGIGLATVHRIIQRHNGKIWAESKINQGTTFFFALPS